jgi:hypothetical protein
MASLCAALLTDTLHEFLPHGLVELSRGSVQIRGPAGLHELAGA